MDSIMEEKVLGPFYVLVAKKEELRSLNLYLNNMKSLGLYFENVPGQSIDLIFIKVSICLPGLQHFSDVYDIGKERDYLSFTTEPIFSFVPFPTPVSVIQPKKPGELTNAESIMIVHKILESTKFSHSDSDYGMSKLIRKGMLMDGYPLHDGPAIETGINDRSLLLRFWSNVSLMHKEQPLDLIQRYFGHEVAFYFAWLEYFNLFLIVPSLVGAILFLFSLVYTTFSTPEEIVEVCNAQQMMCPVCEHLKNCEFVKLGSFCSMSRWAYIFDNYFTIGFALFMCFIASLFVTVWYRMEAMLKLRWNINVEVEHIEAVTRPIYLETVKRRRRNHLTGELEPYVPLCVVICRYFVSIAVCLIMILIMLLFLLLNITTTIQFREIMSSYASPEMAQNKIIFSILLGAFIQLFYIKLMSLVFRPLTLKLTNLENPRTQSLFDNSLLYKRYILAFINNLMPLFYLAFVKGQLYTVPHKNDFYFKGDVCQPDSCIIPLCIQLTFLLTLRSFAGNLGNFLMPRIKKLFKFLFRIKEKDVVNKLPQWEQEYFLQPCGKYFLMSEYSEMMVKYAMITFFAGVFPLAPLCALINNLLEARSDAFKLVRDYRRPVPVKKSSIGAWNGILEITTYISAATNAFTIAFTSDFVVNKLYHIQTEAPRNGFYHFILSRYRTADYPPFQKLKNHVDTCFYRGQYYPPEYAEAYRPNKIYWMSFSARFISIFIFEHIVLLSHFLLKQFIPAVPTFVKQQIYLKKKEHSKEKIIELIDATIVKQKKSLTEMLKVDTNYIY